MTLILNLLHILILSLRCIGNSQVIWTLFSFLGIKNFVRVRRRIVG